eukprot:1375615-Rhodomonas_salina.3
MVLPCYAVSGTEGLGMVLLNYAVSGWHWSAGTLIWNLGTLSYQRLEIKYERSHSWYKLARSLCTEAEHGTARSTGSRLSTATECFVLRSPMVLLGVPVPVLVLAYGAPVAGLVLLPHPLKALILLASLRAAVDIAGALRVSTERWSGFRSEGEGWEIGVSSEGWGLALRGGLGEARGVRSGFRVHGSRFTLKGSRFTVKRRGFTVHG